MSQHRARPAAPSTHHLIPAWVPVEREKLQRMEPSVMVSYRDSRKS